MLVNLSCRCYATQSISMAIKVQIFFHISYWSVDNMPLLEEAVSAKHGPRALEKILIEWHADAFTKVRPSFAPEYLSAILRLTKCEAWLYFVSRVLY